MPVTKADMRPGVLENALFELVRQAVRIEIRRVDRFNRGYLWAFAPEMDFGFESLSRHEAKLAKLHSFVDATNRLE